MKSSMRPSKKSNGSGSLKTPSLTEQVSGLADLIKLAHIEKHIDLLAEIEDAVPKGDLIFHGQYNLICRQIVQIIREVDVEEKI